MLTAVFPIVMLTVAVERRSIDLKIRRLRWFRFLSVAALVSSFVGLGLVLLGVEHSGLGALWGSVAWLCAGASVGVLTATLIAVLATAEVEEDREEAPLGAN
ncbi:hypothetical protein SAMN05216219_1537 [Mycetocola miduiensis]|uniref:Uncharacterized protein n=1 Tax=Mycetocola miduiensis TaxID=995034 RepID=A0A1I5ATU8_9MICO|nr:hypothetical protein SAMN05216219_1537 [Mycetocola miduiensis]